MRTIVFLGPTLSLEEASALLEAEFQPPAGMGDIWRAAQDEPKILGIVDGYFHHRLAPWHREILWAMSRGVRVFGSASMGALRAAELHRQGMVGVGVIFEAFRDGVLTDDDEVAIIHGDGSRNYEPLSDAMVNVRATLRGAREGGVISIEDEAALLRIAKELYYPERTWPRILLLGNRAGLIPGAVVGQLQEWLKDHKVDQKAEDARCMLRRMREAQERPAASDSGTCGFMDTTIWRQFLAGEQARQDDEVLEELALRLHLDPDLARLFAGRRLDWNPQCAAGLRSRPDYAALASRARRKTARRAFPRQGTRNPSGSKEDEMLRWFFEERLGGWPDDVRHFLAERNWMSESQVIEAVTREFDYCQP